MDRTHQEKIARVKQEIAVIIETLRMQEQTFSSISGDPVHGHQYEGFDQRPTQVILNNDNSDRRNTVRWGRSRHHDYSHTPAHNNYVSNEYHNIESKLSATDPNGFRDLLARSCSDLAETKLQRFEEMEYNATDLERRVTQAPPRVARQQIAHCSAESCPDRYKQGSPRAGRSRIHHRDSRIPGKPIFSLPFPPQLQVVSLILHRTSR